MANKVYGVGLSNAKVIPITTSGDTNTLPTYGVLFDLPGVINMTVEPQSSSAKLYSDNALTLEFNAFTEITGTLEFANLPEKFYTDILGWEKGANGELIENVRAKIKEFAFLAEIKTDDKKVRVQFYKISVKPHNETIQTQGEEITPQTVSFEFTALPRLKDGYTRVKMVEPASGAAAKIQTQWTDMNTKIVEKSK